MVMNDTKRGMYALMYWYKAAASSICIHINVSKSVITQTLAKSHLNVRDIIIMLKSSVVGGGKEEVIQDD